MEPGLFLLIMCVIPPVAGSILYYFILRTKNSGKPPWRMETQQQHIRIVPLVIGSDQPAGGSKPVNSRQNLRLETGTDAKYQVGQVWRPANHPTLRITILRIDAGKLDGKLTEVIVHVRVDGANMIAGGSPELNSIPHLPMLRDALEASQLELVQENARVPAYQEGYDIWLEAYLEDGADAFDVPISDLFPI